MDFVFILIKNENINRHDWMDKYEHWTRLDTIGWTNTNIGHDWTRLDGQIRTLDTIGHDWTRLKMIVSIVI